MSAIDKEELKAQLRAMVAGRGDGIDIDTPFHWVIEGLKQPVPFFKQLPMLLPSDSILYVEGTTIVSEVASFYSAHHARNAVAVVRDTIAPVPDIYHFSFSSDVSTRLGRFAESRPVAEMFDHIKAYRGETLLFTFHDAFDGWLRIAEHIPEDTVARFGQLLGVTHRREQTKQRKLEELRTLLRTLEHSDQVKICVKGESWLRRAKRWLTGR
ncbi:MAG: hypothetical protein HZA90_01320 [Verrucomicrobia bacterium]|nr:hypothetical protein [Verrucomicrobiota bacterium]